MRPVLSLVRRALFFGYLAVLTSAHAADWLTVANDRVRRVELDRASITPSDAGTKVAWGRIVLSDEQAKAYGYRTVRALNRYDCRSHAFIIVKRVYLSSDDNVLREDKVDATAPISVKTGTVDDRFFNEVCKPASVADLKKTASEAAQRLATAEERITEKPDAERSKPVVRRADIQLTRDEPAAPKTPAMPTIGPEAAPNKEARPLAIKPDIRRSLAEARAAALTSASSAAPAIPAPTRAAAAPSLTERERLLAEQSAARAALRVAAMSPHNREPALSIVRRPPTPPQAPMTGPPPVKDTHLHWSYEGQAGPENWGKLDPEFSVCNNGKRQSPIDIRGGIKVDQEAILFDYKPSYFRIVDNGHTVQVTYGAGSHITVMGRTYDLVQFHFHHPAEERVDGKGFAMVAHLVHRDTEGRLAVVAVLLESGQANSFIQTLWNNLPLEKNEDYAPRIAIQAADLLPGTRDYISYIGSLTTPPCTEGVLWLVMKQAVQLSAEQIDVFSRFYPNNARPLQAVAGRTIKESR